MIDLQVNVRVNNKRKVVAITLPFGSYRADFERKKVEFSKTYIALYEPDIRTEIRFNEKELSPKPGYEGVFHYFDSIDILGYDYNVEIEYLDTTKGEIELHSHPTGVEEVYFSAEEPYCGEVCREGESHKPWATKTVAIKIIQK